MPQPAARVPYCIVATVRWGSVRTLRVPETFIPRVTAHGWIVLIKDSEMPTGYLEPPVRGWMPWQRNPIRTEHWKDDEDGWRT